LGRGGDSSRGEGIARASRRGKRFVPGVGLDALETRQLLTTYVEINIINNTQAKSASNGLPSSGIYVFFTQEKINVTWSIDPGTGIASANAPGVLAPSFTLAQLASAGGAIKVDSTAVVDSARVYLSSSSQAVTISNGGAISGPTPGTAEFYYDFVEFALNQQPGVLNIDTTQVDQLGIPMTLQVTPNDPNFPAGSGIVSTLDRQALIANFRSMATGPLAPFLDCVFTASGMPTTVYRLLNPADVIASQIHATTLRGTITTSGSKGNWQATYTITGPGSPAPTNGGLTVGMRVSGPLIPAGATIDSLPGAPNGQQVVLRSTAGANPFTASSGPVELYFFRPPTTALASYFDQSIDDFFTFYKTHPNLLQVEQNSGGQNVVYTGNVVRSQQFPNIDGGMSSYTIVQFTGHGETYNIFYPFFTTNSPAGKKTPFGDPVPPPPTWWNSVNGLAPFEPPSQMVFAANGVFADGFVQSTLGVYPHPPNAAILGALENVIVTALARGYATTWQFLQGEVVQGPQVNGQFPRTATVNLTSGNTTGLTNQMYISSFQIANVPLTPSIPSGSPVTSFPVSSPVPIPPAVADLLTFARHYPPGGTWSAFANFLHNGAGHEITIDGRAYALPFDDQGGFSSDLNAATSAANPASVSIVLGPWAPKARVARDLGNAGGLGFAAGEAERSTASIPAARGLAGAMGFSVLGRSLPMTAALADDPQATAIAPTLLDTRNRKAPRPLASRDARVLRGVGH
jgi:hypothetical protein